MRNLYLPRTVSALVLVLGLTGCWASTQSRDNRIKLMSSVDGRTMVAIPPECLNRYNYNLNPEENQMPPQYGCAMAHNLAAQVASPEDLVNPDPLGYADPVVAAASIQDYRAGQSKPLIDAKAEAPTATAPTGSGAAP